MVMFFETFYLKLYMFVNMLWTNNVITLLNLKYLKMVMIFTLNFLYVCATFLIKVQSFDIQMGL